MQKTLRLNARSLCIAGTLTIMAAFSLGVRAADDIEDLKRQMESLQSQIEQLQRKLDERAASGDESSAEKEKIAELESEIQKLKKSQSELTDAESVVHLGGYGTVGYTNVENENGGFTTVMVNPILHYQYKDLMLLESELEMVVTETGETEFNLEYGTIDWLFSDYGALVVGKFLSPIGQFRQNMHPGWINKFSDAPPGFGHDGAAPVSEIGAQIRGGAPLTAGSRMNYAAYVGNGPIVTIDGTDLHVEAEGTTSNADGEMVFGGRLGFLPISSLEVGVSGAVGDVAPEGEEDLKRSYDVYGADMAWRPGKGYWDFRGEYIKTKVGGQESSAAPEAAAWEAWYAQAAYRFLPSKWEAVVRYGDFNSPYPEDDQKQVGAGINYWFSPSAVAKIGYERNDGLEGEISDLDRWLLQMSYGF